MEIETGVRTPFSFHNKVDSSNLNLFFIACIGSDHSDTSPQKYNNGTTTVPPPLPPKPKIKPSSWAGSSNWQLNDIKFDGVVNDSPNLLAHSARNVKAPIADRISMLSATMADKKMTQPRTIYFDRMNSSFV